MTDRDRVALWFTAGAVLMVLVLILMFAAADAKLAGAQDTPSTGAPTELTAAPPHQSAPEPYTAPVSVQARSCMLVVGPIVDLPVPPGYDGASVQITRNGRSHARSDSSAPYGPFSATVDQGRYELAARLSKRDMPSTSVPLGAVVCGVAP